VSATELLDDLEAGELSVEFEGEEPRLSWNGRSSASRTDWRSTAFRRRCRDRHGPPDRPEGGLLLDRHKWLPTETFELIETLRERYQARPDPPPPDAPQLQRLVDRHGPNLFTARSAAAAVLHVRKVQPLTRYLGGVDAVTGLRRPVGGPPVSRRWRSTDHGAIVKLNPPPVDGG
jgi:hypothetical protein